MTNPQGKSLPNENRFSMQPFWDSEDNVPMIIVEMYIIAPGRDLRRKHPKWNAHYLQLGCELVIRLFDIPL